MTARYLAATETLGACVHEACRGMPPAMNQLPIVCEPATQFVARRNYQACHVMPPPAAASANPLPCRPAGEYLDVDEAWLDP